MSKLGMDGAWQAGGRKERGGIGCLVMECGGQSEASTPLWNGTSNRKSRIHSPRLAEDHTRPAKRRLRRAQSRTLSRPPGAGFQQTLVVVECGGRAKRRHRCGTGHRIPSRGSIHHARPKFAPVLEATGYIAAWRFASRRTPQGAGLSSDEVHGDRAFQTEQVALLLSGGQFRPDFIGAVNPDL